MIFILAGHSRPWLHTIEQPRFPVIDYHNHLDSMNPKDVLAVMDRCGVERVVNITMQVGNRALEIIDRYHATAPDRFSSIGWMDWERRRTARLCTGDD